MKLETLTDLYVKELHDMYDAEHQIVEALPKMIEAARSQDLRSALSQHLEQTHGHVQRLERVLQLQNEDVKREKCKGLAGIVDEGKEIMKHDDNPEVTDAGIIAGAQKVEHYEMAGYGTLRTWAEQLGLSEAAQLLQQTLQEEKDADRILTEIAARRNQQAARGAGDTYTSSGGSYR